MGGAGCATVGRPSGDLSSGALFGGGAPFGGDALFDGVLLDVPCTATGTGRRRPDVLRKALPPNRAARRGAPGSPARAAAEDFGALLALQAALAEHCARALLAPGGVLVYSTCR